MLSVQAFDTLLNARSEQQLTGYGRVQKYLLDRGIDATLIDKLHLRIFPARELFALVYSSALANRSQDDRLAIVFPHYNFAGQQIDWWSARLIEHEKPRAVASFADLVKRGARPKMMCPPDNPPHAYLPPILDWKTLKKGEKVYIHESAIKAVNGAKFGRYSIGLNGVWGFKSKKHDIRLISELRDIPWKQRELQPIIVFDSNAADNWDVQNAIVQLSATLFEVTGRRPRHILLPMHESEHQGFDDFCQRHTPAEVEAYLDQDGEEVEISEVQQLLSELNQRVVVVRSLGRIAEQETGTLMSKAVFTDVNYGHYVVLVEDGDNVVQKNIPRLWLTDARRSEVERLDYVPGGQRIDNGALNLWRGMGAEPRSGDITPFLDLLENNIPQPHIREWLLQWFAYPLQVPGGKASTFVHVFGPSGTGKNMMILPLSRIYGPNFVTIAKEQIESTFNSVYSTKQLIHLDELHGGNQDTARKIANKIKMLVTGETIVVNQKGQPEYEVRNRANLITTSNYFDSIKLDDDDRRACVVRFRPVKDVRHDESYWQRYVNWAENGGAEALLDHLLKLDITSFNPRSWAPETEEKKQVKEATKTGVEDWVDMLVEDADGVIAPIFQSRCLFTTKELASMLYGDADPGQGQIISLGKALQNKGFEKADNGSLIKIKGSVQRYWIIKKRDQEWTRDRILKHLSAF